MSCYLMVKKVYNGNVLFKFLKPKCENEPHVIFFVISYTNHDYKSIVCNVLKTYNYPRITQKPSLEHISLVS